MGVSPYKARHARKQVAATIVERGPHHALHHWSTEQMWPDGRTIVQNHYVTELASGLNYLKDGELVPSREEIEIINDVAIAGQGQFQVIFGSELNAAGAIDLSTEDGKRFQSRILGLVYLDTASGASVLIAETQNSQGQVLPPNRVFYLDAFNGDGIQADVRYTYQKGSFEQDIIFRTRPHPPSAYGLPDETTRIEVWTEFFDPPVARKQAVVLRNEDNPLRRQQLAVPDLVDHRLDFGQAQIGSGRAFMVENGVEDPSDGLRVAKDWVTLPQQGGQPRTFLVESVDYAAVRPWLNTLPGAQAAVKPQGAPAAMLARKRADSRAGLLAVAVPMHRPGKNLNQAVGAHKARWTINPQLYALNRQRGVVLDYVTLNTSLTNQVFKADQTYRISGPVNLYGSSNVIEGGSVLKFNQSAGATIDVKGTLIGDTDLYRPAVLTASADGTVGESIGGTLSGYYATTALNFDYVTSGQLASLQNIRILYAVTGVKFNGGSGHELRHLQLVNCGDAFRADNAQYAIRNVLGWNLTNALIGSSSTGVLEHATFNGVTNLLASAVGQFTNCLFTAVVNTTGLDGAGNSVFATSNGVFKTVGYGYHYLADGSALRDAGVTNINPTLAGELKKRTTFAPLALPNLTSNLIFSVRAERDTGLFDIGWRYAPLDYYASATVVTNATIIMTNGVALGLDVAASWGLDLRTGTWISVGTPTSPNYIVRAHMAQEKSGGNPGTRACFYDGNSAGASRSCALRMRFTEFSQLQNDGYLIYVGTKFSD